MTTSSPRTGIRRYLIPAAAAALILAATGVIVIARAGATSDTATSATAEEPPAPTSSGPPSAAASGDPAPAGRAPLPPGSSTSVRVPTGRASAREPLRRLAAALVASPADTEPGTWEYVAEQQWAGNTTVRNGVGTTEMIPMTHQRWRATDRSGRTLTREYPPGTATITTGTRSTRTDVSTFAPGELPGPADLGTGRATITAAITDRAQPENGVTDVVRAVDELYRDRAPRVAARAAILEVLADADLDWTGSGVDKTGRACLIVSVDTRNPPSPGVSRDLLYLDPATGEVTGYELVLLTNPGALAGPFPQTADLHLYTTRGRRTTAR
jgi:hypothetical protein